MLAAIHCRCFEASWDEGALKTLLGQPGSFGRIAISGQPAGFVLCRRAADEMEILTLCVLPEMRRRHVAARLLRSALGGSEAAGIRRAFLEVAVSNEPALRLYRGIGFEPVGQRPGYYRAHESEPLDAVILSWWRPEATASADADR